MKTLKLVVLAGLILAMAVAWWMWRQPRVKTIPASGGANMQVTLADRGHFMQNDPRWAKQRFGSRDTLAGAGCTMSSVAMAMNNLGHATDPGQLAAALTAGKGITPEGWILWEAVSRVSNGGLRVEVHTEPSQERLDACLARGEYPIVKFFIRGVVPHWVVLVGKRGGTYLMRDPLIAGAAPLPLTRRTAVIYSVRCIGLNPHAVQVSRPEPPQPAPPKPAPASAQSQPAPAAPPQPAPAAAPPRPAPASAPPQPAPVSTPPKPVPAAVPPPPAPAPAPSESAGPPQMGGEPPRTP